MIPKKKGKEKEKVYHLSVTSLLCQKLFISGSINNPDVKLNGVNIISKFNRLPTILNRMPERNFIISMIVCYIDHVTFRIRNVYCTSLKFIYYLNLISSYLLKDDPVVTLNRQDPKRVFPTQVYGNQRRF